MLVYVNNITPRLQYIFDFIGKEILLSGFELTTDRKKVSDNNVPCVSYSDERIFAHALHIRPTSLLFQTGIKEQATTSFDVNGFKAFFRTDGDLPFDIFAASFFLLSRYEEYLPHKKDSYGRYAHENSLAFREGFLDTPLVNRWMQYLQNILRERFPSLTFRSSSFLFVPTYDIDIAWSYKHKGLWRQAGGMMRLLLRGKWSGISERIAVLRGKVNDPFDAYGWMNRLHEKYKLKPYYFFLLAKQTGRYDKNISPGKTAMKALIEDHLIRYPVGIHPSWQSGDNDELLATEIMALRDLSGSSVRSSRQHYIRFTLPQTFRKLIAQGIEFDFSMGYGSINGFRASVATPFFWFDLEHDSATKLLLFPFCFMEANSFYEQHYSSRQSLEEMKHYYAAVKEINGTFITIWHNSFLGTDRLYQGWREAYEEFIASL